MYLLLHFPADTKQLDLQAGQKIETEAKISPLCIVTKKFVVRFGAMRHCFIGRGAISKIFTTTLIILS
jgi:hypothetical protein